MKLVSLLQPGRIRLDAPCKNREEALQLAAELFAETGVAKSAQDIFSGMKDREKVMSTGIGDGISIPHTAGPYVQKAGVVILRLNQPIEFDSLDKYPVDVLISMVVPQGDTGLHLQILACISRLCKNPEFIPAVRQAEDAEKLLARIGRIENSMEFH